MIGRLIPKVAAVKTRANHAVVVIVSVWFVVISVVAGWAHGTTMQDAVEEESQSAQSTESQSNSDVEYKPIDVRTLESPEMLYDGTKEHLPFVDDDWVIGTFVFREVKTDDLLGTRSPRLAESRMQYILDVNGVEMLRMPHADQELRIWIFLIDSAEHAEDVLRGRKLQLLEWHEKLSAFFQVGEIDEAEPAFLSGDITHCASWSMRRLGESKDMQPRRYSIARGNVLIEVYAQGDQITNQSIKDAVDFTFRRVGISDSRRMEEPSEPPSDNPHPTNEGQSRDSALADD